MALRERKYFTLQGGPAGLLDGAKTDSQYLAQLFTMPTPLVDMVRASPHPGPERAKGAGRVFERGWAPDVPVFGPNQQS